MKQQDRNRLLYGMALVVLASGVAYACKDFLNIPAQGTVIEQSLETKAGVEGSLIAAYRSLDCSSSSAGSWGCAASNWVWGSIPSVDAHKGSNAGDQQPINDIQIYARNVGDAERYLNQTGSQAYALLRATQRGGDKVRATKWTAMAYKGRVQAYGAALTAALWDSALVTFRAVRAANVYALQSTFDSVWTGFQAAKNGKETILAFQASVRD